MKALSLNPDDFGAAFGLGNMLFEQGKYKLAKKYLLKALEIAKSKETAALANSAAISEKKKRIE